MLFVSAIAYAYEDSRRQADDEQKVILNTRLDIATPVLADYDRILQVVQNLLSNAIKFSEAGGEVLVQVGVTEAGAICEVKDEGAGVSEAFRDQLFERFAQQESGSVFYFELPLADQEIATG